jgi:MoaA/NifB/PqqE/SkfB family radical SAM enzyme
MLNTNEVRIETCTLCNYACIFCPHSTKFKRKKEVMSLDTFRFIVDKIKDELPDITDLTISGFGEAFLDKTILEKIKYARDLDYKVHVLTNGSLLTSYKIDFLHDVGIEDIRISLHSINVESYRKLTKPPIYRFQVVMSNIQHILQLTSIPLILTFETIPGINDNEIEEIKEVFSKHATIELWKPHNWVSTYKYRIGEAVKNTCGRPLNSPYQIQVDGTVNMCCFDYNGELLLGNFLNQTMKEIFNGDVYIDLRKNHLNGTLDQTDYICKNCDQRKSQEGIVIYNNKFKEAERLNRTSTNYEKIS